MKTTPIHPRFGVEVHDTDLAQVTAERGYPEIRELFEQHSLLLFRDQHINDAQHLAFGQLFGVIEDRTLGANGPDPQICKVSNTDISTSGVDGDELRLLNLKANQLWHTDSTFLPYPALANILRAVELPDSGGETELVSTRVAWTDMPQSLRERVQDRVFRHRYSHSRKGLSEELSHLPLFTMWEDQLWNALWPNPVTGEDALYLASHIVTVEGMDQDEADALLAELNEFATRDEYVYTHDWQVGDVLVWDERATMHRGRPWPYEQTRTLHSICITVGERDGLGLVQPSIA